MKQFLKAVMSATSQESSKRFVVVMSILIFLLLANVMIVLMILLFLKLLPVPATTVELFFSLFGKVVDNMFFVICFGIGAIAVTNSVSFLSTVFSRKADAAVIAASKGVPDTNINADVTVNNQQ